jgi:hypothetical protein
VEAEDSATDTVLEVKSGKVVTGTDVVRQSQNRMLEPVAVIKQGSLPDPQPSTRFLLLDHRTDSLDARACGLGLLIEVHDP